ncbi:MAG: TetR/AcrR family transcriptional regulator [Gemmatimonadales bacterium]
MEIGAKPTTQRRAERTRDRLIDALDSLLRERPFPEIAVADIARRAGVSTGTVYQRFQNRDASVSILLALYYRRVQEWSAAPGGRVAEPGDLRSALELIGRNAWRQVAELGYVMRPAYLHSRLSPDLVGPTWARLERIAQRGYQELLAKFESEIARDDPARTAGTMAAFINLMALSRLLHPESAAPFLQSREAFVRDFVDLAYHYLTNPSVGSAPTRRERKRMT